MWSPYLLKPVSRERLAVLLDRRNIAFLEQFRGDDQLVIAAISSGPLLLGKAGLLEGRRFCHGVFEEFLEEFPVVPWEGVVRAKLAEDGNLVTALGDAFREFAAATARRVGLDCPETVFDAVAEKTSSEEICTLHFPSEARVYLGPSIPRLF